MCLLSFAVAELEMDVAIEKRTHHVDVEPLTSPKHALVFISHDNRDADIAECFSALLKSTSTGMLRSFRSSDRKGVQGIEYGSEWYQELMKNLQSASEVVCLLTQHSLERPWILYEAGVAIGKRKTPVLGIALGIPLSRASTGPFAQFQNCADDEESLTKLVMQLMRRIPNADSDRKMVRRQVRAFKKKVSQILEIFEGEDQLTNHDQFFSMGMETIRYLRDENLQEHLESAQDIRVLKTWFPETEPIETGLKEAIKRGAKLKLLLCKPNSILLQQRSSTALKGKYLGSNVVYHAIENILKWVRASSELKVEIGVYDSWPGCPVIWYDDKILMGFYFRRAPSPEWPWVSVTKGKEMARILDEQFWDLWFDEDTRLLKTRKDMKDWLKENAKWKELTPRLSPQRQVQSRISTRSKLQRKGEV